MKLKSEHDEFVFFVNKEKKKLLFDSNRDFLAMH